MRNALIAVVLTVLLHAVVPAQSQDAESPVHFVDARLKELVEQALWIDDPTPLDMLQLTSLNVQGNEITDITGLEYATNLQTLIIRWNHISDLTPLAGLTNLQHLDAHGNRIIRDLSPLAHLVNLKTLVIRLNDITDISALAGTVSLQDLQIQGNSIEDVTPLAGLTDLQNLVLTANCIRDVSPLAGLMNLQELSLRLNPIDDISPLAGLVNLRDLDLVLTNVSDFSPLSGLTNLRHLNASYTGVADISLLLGLPYLESLDLEGSEDLSEQAYCEDLWTFYYYPRIDLKYAPNRRPPAGVWASQGEYHDKIQISWEPVCSGPLYTSFYRVYRTGPPDYQRSPVSGWQRELSFDDRTAQAGIDYSYEVRTATSDEGADAGDFSETTPGWLSRQPALTVSSTAGGSVVMPGEGTFFFNGPQSVEISAQPTEEGLYSFAGWTGTAVKGGKVANSAAATTSVAVDGNYTLRAHFVACLAVIHVDANAANDPKPGDAGQSDPNENGTAAHPFDSIQEAIDVAADGATLLVHPGVYAESIDLLGKGLCLMGFDPDPNGPLADLPTITGNGAGPAVSFVNGEDPNCLLIGFVITAGHPQQTGAVVCLQSSPVLANCLIVGNRTTDPHGAAVWCNNSQATLVNCTIADNVGGGLGLIDSQVVLANSIVWANTPSQIALDDKSEPTITHSDVQGGWPDVGNLDTDPLFARPGHWTDPDGPAGTFWVPGDYHLRSQAGRWDPQARLWVHDAVTSPGIDAGDPADSVEPEPVPNGSLINLGAYGGTVQASRSPGND